MPFTENFTAAFSEALRSAAATQLGAAWDSEVVPSPAEETSPSLADGSVVALQFGGALEGELYFCPDEQISREAFPATEPPSPETFPSAWLGLLQNSVDGITQTLSTHFGAVQVRCQLNPPRSEAFPLAKVQLRTGDASIGTVTLLIDAALRARLSSGDQPRPATDAPVPVSALSAAGVSEAAPLHRVIDVPLAVTLRFGQRQLTLRELLELNTGSLVELDRQVEEPVDLMLGERVIARGEVVIVDGNYGMRVLEVVEMPVNRLSALA